MTRVLVQRDPFAAPPANGLGAVGSDWPCRWVCLPGDPQPPFVSAYRLEFELERDAVVRAHVSADERYELYLDDVRVGRGPERCDPEGWCYESYDLVLEKGAHSLVARVWSWGERAALSQMSVRPGFLFAPESEEMIRFLGSGVAPWEAALLPGCRLLPKMKLPGYFALGPDVKTAGGALDWTRAEWLPAEVLRGARPMRPAMLPPMIERACAPGVVRFCSHALEGAVEMAAHDEAMAEEWNGLWHEGRPLTIPPGTAQRALFDFDDYFCAYPELAVSGGSGGEIVLSWAESLFEEAGAFTKGNRDEIEGKFFAGLRDRFLPGGGEHESHELLWWKCGRYLQVTARAGEVPLVIERLALRETRYPLEVESAFGSDEPRLATMARIATRTLQMCSHETYMDCPYYEQLMYVGDTRLQVLATYALTRDDRLPRKAITLFDTSRGPSGLTGSRHPSRERQVIPPFSLWWVAMVHDFALWRGDADFVRGLMPGVRAVLDHFHGCVDASGLLGAPAGWNFADWTVEWERGVPPDGAKGVSGVLGWQLVLVLELAAQLEEWQGEPELAARHRRHGSRLAATATAFWNEPRGLFADDLGQAHFSEHANCLALLSGHVPADRRERMASALFTDAGLTRTTIYFSHYLFEVCALLGRLDVVFARLEEWFALPASGFKTTFERPPAPGLARDESRSDCHAWGAHPLYHQFATILGIRPAAFGFEKICIQPQLGPLREARGRLPHPRGEIEVDLRRDGDRLVGEITLPPGISGTFVSEAGTLELHPGSQALR